MSAPEPTAEHKRTAARLIDAIYDRGTVDAIECKAAEGLIAHALAAREARGFERGRAAGPAPYVDPLADAAGNRHHKDGSRCTDPNCQRAHALPAVLFTLSVEPLPCSRCGFNGVPGTTHSTSCLYPEPR